MFNNEVCVCDYCDRKDACQFCLFTDYPYIDENRLYSILVLNEELLADIKNNYYNRKD